MQQSKQTQHTSSRWPIGEDTGILSIQYVW